ncbi:MAG: tryptophanase [Bacilli bacterium]|nr:tryptophanase [Bacilli bacterium]
MSNIKFFKENNLPLEMHKVRIVQKLNLLPIDERLKAIQQAGNNTFLLKNRDVYLDMLTDSGTNAMSDRQLGAMMIADDSYAGSETFYRLEKAVQAFFGKEYFLPAHQGRACENILAKTLVKPGDVVPMNYHFTTTKTHINMCGGRVEEIFKDEAIELVSTNPFKGDMDLGKLESLINEVGSEHIPFVRIEMGTNLIGGQPVSLQNVIDVAEVCKKHHILLMIDASLMTDNLYFNKVREEKCKDMSIAEIARAISDCADIIYFSARKLGSAKGGGIVVNDKALYDAMKVLIPVYEGFLTYGGMSTREMEAVAIGLEEATDIDMISHGPEFIHEFGRLLQSYNVPIVTPTGGLGIHLNAREIVGHIPGEQYQAAALAAAIYIVSGARGMERGTLSEEKNPDGSEHIAACELVRLALPRRVFTLSQIRFAADRIAWLYENRHLIGGLKFVEEPSVMRFFIGRLAPIGNWQEELVKKFKEDFGESL